MFRLEGVIIRLFVEPYRGYIQYSAHFGIPNVHCTWCIYDMVQRIAWWWHNQFETCRYMHNLSIINRCVWLKLYILSNLIRRSQWPRGLRRRSAAARLLRTWVRIPPGAWMFVYCECRVLSGRGLCDELINRPEESYPLWCVVVCDLETSRMRRPWPAMCRSATAKKK